MLQSSSPPFHACERRIVLTSGKRSNLDYLNFSRQIDDECIRLCFLLLRILQLPQLVVRLELLVTSITPAVLRSVDLVQIPLLLVVNSAPLALLLIPAEGDTILD